MADWLKIGSCMAENTEPVLPGHPGYIGDKIGVEAEYVAGIPWQERERMFAAGEIQVLWLCGLPYIRRMANAAETVVLQSV